jgi:acyl carrier protein
MDGEKLKETTLKTQVSEIVKEAIVVISETRSDRLNLDDIDSLVLYGDSGILDSLQLVNLLIGIEEKLADKFDLRASLTSDRAVSRQVSPFRSTAHLVDFVLEEIGHAAGGR